MVKTVKFLSVVCAIMLLDRLFKELALNSLVEPVSVIPNLLTLRLAFNNGVAFGMLNQWPVIIEIITVIIILGAIYALPKIDSYLVWPMSLIIGGAAGNLVDRIRYDHGVIDFIHVHYFSVFNVADIAISVGVVWAILLLWIHDKKAGMKKLPSTKPKKKSYSP